MGVFVLVHGGWHGGWCWRKVVPILRAAGHEVSPAPAAYPHVGVVARPDRDGVVHSLVYPAVTQGEYELYPLPDGPVVMTASVIGGQVTRNRWPG